MIARYAFEQLCPTYQKALVSFVNDFNNAPDFSSKEKLFWKFTRKFTTLPEIWIYWISYVKACYPDLERKTKDLISIKAMSHFYHENILLEIKDQQPENHFLNVWTKVVQCPKPKLLWPKNMQEKISAIKLVEKKLLLPTCSSKLFYEFYDEYSNNPIPHETNRKYENANILTNKICRAFLSNEQWLNFLKETNDDQLIIQNFEKRLSSKPWDKTLWLLYLSFTNEKQFYIITLETYSRYCRFFVEDNEIRNKYHTEIERIKEMNIDVTKYQFDLVNILQNFVSKESAAALLKDYFKDISDEVINQKLKEPLSIFDNVTFPSFSVDQEMYEMHRQSQPIPFQLSFVQNIGLPESILYYTLKNSNSKLLQKLYSSSKQIYSIFRKPVCHRLEIRDLDSTVSFQQSLYISKTTLNFKTAKDLYLTNALDISHCRNTVLSTIIPNIYKCEVRYLTIHGQTITLEEFEFFVSNVTFFKMSESTIGEKETVSIKGIIQRMPKVTKIRLSNISNIFFLDTKVEQPNARTAIKIFDYQNVTEMVDPELLLDFILKNDNNFSSFNLTFDPKIEESYKTNLKNRVQFHIKSSQHLRAHLNVV